MLAIKVMIDCSFLNNIEKATKIKPILSVQSKLNLIPLWYRDLVSYNNNLDLNELCEILKLKIYVLNIRLSFYLQTNLYEKHCQSHSLYQIMNCAHE